MRCASLLLVLLLAWACPAAADLAPLVADVTVNGQADGVAVLMRDRRGRIYAEESTLRRWRLVGALPRPVVVDGRTWYELDALPGLETVLNLTELTLDVRIGPQLLPATRIGPAPAPPLPSVPRAGAFLDYEAGHVASGSQSGDLWSLALEPTVFGPMGSLRSGTLWRSAPANGTGQDGWLRLDTTWTVDDPARVRSWRFGDAIAGGASWQRSLRFGGVQLGTNFATRPRMNTLPQPAVRGTAVLPSTIEILVDGQRRGAEEIPPGEWAVEEFPVTTGAGEITVVATDLAGRRQEYAVDFYIGARQLRAGLSDFSLSAGWTRQDFGFESFDYGDPFVSASFRHGQTDRLTWEVAGEASAGLVAAGLGGAYSIPGLGLGSLDVAASRDESGATGLLWQVGLERRARLLTFSAALQGTTADFRQLGYDGDDRRIRRQALASIGFGLGPLGSLSWTFARQEPFAEPVSSFSQLGLTRTLPGGVSLSAFWRRTRDADSDSVVGLTANWRIGRHNSAAAGVVREDERWSSTVEYQRDLPLDDGVGYRLRHAAGDARLQELSIFANAGAVRLDGDLRRSEASTDWSVFAGGSVVWLDGLHLARLVRGSFAVVDTAGIPDVRVYWENQPVGRSGADGTLLIPFLRPYDTNRLSVAIDDLPLTAQLADPVLEVVPFDQAGVVAAFSIRASRPVTLRLVGPGGGPVPAGAVVHSPDSEGDWPVGFDGRVYLPDAGALAEIHARWRGAECEAALPDFRWTGPVHDLGDVRCEPVP